MTTDILMIGAGVNGLLSALFLAREGLRVRVVEQGPAAAESTWAGAGILSPLLPWDYGPEVNAMVERGRELWPDWIERLRQGGGVDPEYLACGMLVLELADKAGALNWCAEHGWRALEPPAITGLAADANALWLPDVAQVRNPRLGQALIAACQAAGVEIMPHTPVRALDLAEGRVEGARTNAGRLTADAYVLCAGAWSRTLLGEETALGVDIRPVRGQILLFKGEPGLLPCILYQGGHYLVPRLDGHVLAGSTLEEDGFDKQVTETARAQLQAFALDAVPALAAAQVVGQWAGLRPGSPGNVPTVAPHPRYGNLYLNSGHFRYGVTMAPASAELLRDLVLGEPPRIDPAPYAWPAKPRPGSVPPHQTKP